MASPKSVSGSPAQSVNDLADVVRQRLRDAGPIASSSWREAFDEVLQEAYRRGDTSGLSRGATYAAAMLESVERRAEAVAQLDFAVGIAEKHDPGEVIHLLGGQAIFLALDARLEEAAEVLATAAKLRSRVDERAQVRFEADEAIAQMISMVSVDIPQIIATAHRVDEFGLEALGSALKAWLVPYLVARGERAKSHPWVDALAAQAVGTSQPARLADVKAFRSALQSTDRPIGSTTRVAAPLHNPNARWRLKLLRLHALLQSGQSLGRARRLASALGHRRGRFVSGAGSSASSLRALVDAYDPRTAGVDPAPPAVLTLVNLPWALAGMEAGAIAGSQATAGSWVRWSESELPRSVRTSLEWPVAVDRISGLLLVRAGAYRDGAAALRGAIAWSVTNGYPVEASLATLQLAETLAHTDVDRPRGESPEAMRRAAFEALVRSGVDPVRHAYAATRAVSAAQGDRFAPRLSPREVQVLELLATGLTYRQAASDLGISWRTVQLHAYHTYQKLDVPGRVQAVAAAMELGVLSRSPKPAATMPHPARGAQPRARRT